MGTPEFSLDVLTGLIENTNVIGVVTQPDKIVGRDKEPSFSPVKKLAMEHSIPVFQPEKIRKDYDWVINMNPDIIADFEDSKMPQVFEPPYGASYYLEEDEEEMVRITEDRYHVLVWGIVRCFMSYNRKETAVDCMLTVSNNKNEWKQEREDLLNMNPFVYTFMKEHSIRDHGYINLYLSEGGTPLRIL